MALLFPGQRRLRRMLALLGVRPSVVVFQMAKVGSSSVVDALDRAGLAVFHVHRMNAGHLHAMRAERASRGWLVPPVPEHDLLGLRLHQKLVVSGRGGSFVTLVRDPISRNLSSYFEHLDWIWRTRNAHLAIPTEDLCRGFLERYDHSEALTWFDEEMLPVLGIDVYRTPFPSDGHLTIEAAPFRLLILKNEVEDGIKQNALSKFLGCSVPPLVRVNQTEGKEKGAAYREFIRKLRLPPDYVDSILGSRFARHFYGDVERAAIRRRFVSEG